MRLSTAGDKACELLWIAVDNVGTERSRRNVDNPAVGVGRLRSAAGSGRGEVWVGLRVGVASALGLGCGGLGLGRWARSVARSFVYGLPTPAEPRRGRAPAETAGMSPTREGRLLT